MTARAPCLQCDKKRVSKKWAPFCSQRCAARRGIETAMDAHYCPACKSEASYLGWWDHDCKDHPGQALHAGIGVSI